MLKQNNIESIDTLSSYYQLYQVRSNGREYKKTIEIAEQWLKNSLGLSQSFQEKRLNYLLDKFKDANFNDLIKKGKAGLCLRCYISEYIVMACKKRARLFSDQGVTYQALLPFVLDDDGNSLIIIDKEGKQQLEIKENGQLLARNYHVFTVEIVRSYDHQRSKKQSLKNWTYLKTRQNIKLVNFLSEFGFVNSTDWSLLNKIKKYQLQQLTEQEKLIIKVYHEVYRDNYRRKNKLRNKCKDPSSEQLQEMIDKLNIETLKETDILLKELKRIAKQLISNSVSLDNDWVDEEGNNKTREINYYDTNIEEKEESDNLSYIYDYLVKYFLINLDKVIKNQMEKVRKSKSYSLYTSQYINILKAFYQEGKSQTEIANEIGIRQDKLSRICSPKKLVNEVRKQTIENLMEFILELQKKNNNMSNTLSKDDLIKWKKKIEEYADQEIFVEASAEIMNSKNRIMNSFYAQNIINYLNQNS